MKTKEECLLRNGVFKNDLNGYSTNVMKAMDEYASQFQQEWIPVVAVQDDSGHWYVIPKDIQEAFEADVTNDELSDNGEFDNIYGQYRTGGDLNLTQLYIHNPKQP